MDSVDRLIEGLSEELKPTKPLSHPVKRLLPLLFVSLTYVGVVISMLGPRADWSDLMLGEMAYVFEIVLSLSIFIASAFALAWLSIPDLAEKAWVKSVPVTLTGVFLVWAGFRLIYELDQPFHFALSQCNLNGLFMILLPVGFLTYFTRQGATTEPRWAGFMTILSFSGLGWAGLRLTCGADNFVHSFLIHFVPFLILGIIFGVFAKRIFRW